MAQPAIQLPVLVGAKPNPEGTHLVLVRQIGPIVLQEVLPPEVAQAMRQALDDGIKALNERRIIVAPSGALPVPPTPGNGAP